MNRTGMKSFQKSKVVLYRGYRMHLIVGLAAFTHRKEVISLFCAQAGPEREKSFVTPLSQNNCKAINVMYHLRKEMGHLLQEYCKFCYLYLLIISMYTNNNFEPFHSFVHLFIYPFREQH